MCHGPKGPSAGVRMAFLSNYTWKHGLHCQQLYGILEQIFLIILRETMPWQMMNRAALAHRLPLFPRLFGICQAPSPRENKLAGALSQRNVLGMWGVKIRQQWELQQSGRSFLFSGNVNIKFCGQPLEKCGIPLSPSTPCTHFLCCLHLRRRLNQQMLQKRELLNVYSDSTQLLSSNAPPSLLSLIHEHCCEWSSAWPVGFGTQLWQHDFVHGEGEILSLKGLWYAAQEQEGTAHCCARQPLTHPEQRGERAADTSHGLKFICLNHSWNNY